VTQAYFKAYGCTYDAAKSSGYRLLTNVHVQEELRRLREIKSTALGDICGDDIVDLNMISDTFI
jgi:indole-3-glycerol phosphate synthase